MTTVNEFECKFTQEELDFLKSKFDFIDINYEYHKEIPIEFLQSLLEKLIKNYGTHKGFKVKTEDDLIKLSLEFKKMESELDENFYKTLRKKLDNRVVRSIKDKEYSLAVTGDLGEYWYKH